MSQENNQEQSKPRVLNGIVTAVSGTDTIKMRVETKRRHPIYEKILAKHKSYLVHADAEILKALDLEDIKELVGKEVEAIETKPYSKRKTWKLLKLVERN